MKCVPDLSAARAFPTSTTLKLETFSSASTCRDLCSRKLRPDLHLGPARALFVGYFAGPFHREDDAIGLLTWKSIFRGAFAKDNGRFCAA